MPLNLSAEETRLVEHLVQHCAKPSWWRGDRAHLLAKLERSNLATWKGNYDALVNDGWRQGKDSLWRNDRFGGSYRADNALRRVGSLHGEITDPDLTCYHAEHERNQERRVAQGDQAIINSARVVESPQTAKGREHDRQSGVRSQHDSRHERRHRNWVPIETGKPQNIRPGELHLWLRHEDAGQIRHISCVASRESSRLKVFFTEEGDK